MLANPTAKAGTLLTVCAAWSRAPSNARACSVAGRNVCRGSLTTSLSLPLEVGGGGWEVGPGAGAAGAPAAACGQGVRWDQVLVRALGLGVRA